MAQFAKGGTKEKFVDYVPTKGGDDVKRILSQFCNFNDQSRFFVYRFVFTARGSRSKFSDNF